MAAPERRTLGEIITRYDVEESIIGDIYVEGEFDKHLLQWYFNEKGITNVPIYEISTVDIDNDVLSRYGLTSNNRNRIIALANELNSTVKGIDERVACIIDKDLDPLLNIDLSSPVLLYTDFANSEMYLLNRIAIKKFLAFLAAKNTLSEDKFIMDIVNILKFLFCARASNESGYHMTSVNFLKSCSFSTEDITIDEQDYLKRYLMANGKVPEFDKFKAQIDEYLYKCVGDHRHWIHGHDFMELLYWYCIQVKTKVQISVETVSRMMCMCAEVNALEDGVLLTSLVRRFAR